MGTLGDSAKLRARILFLITNIVSVVCLAWVFQGANMGELRKEIAGLQWRWVVVAVISDILVYVWHGWRWSLLLKPVAPVSVRQSVRAIYVGLFANEVLPLRAGEVIRCFLQARWSKIPLSVTLASALIERIFDGFWLIVCLLVTLRYVALPRALLDGGIILAVLVFVFGCLLGIAMYWRQQALDALLGARRFRWVHVLIEDLHLIGHSRYLYFSALASVPYLLMQVIPIYALMKAYRLENFHLLIAFATMVILRLGSVVPQGPGNVGLFQFLTVQALVLFGAANPIAKRFSLILWAVVTLPLLLVGFIALMFTGLNMTDLHREARAGVRSSRERTPTPQI